MQENINWHKLDKEWMELCENLEEVQYDEEV
jgi:hypothetical protein